MSLPSVTNKFNGNLCFGAPSHTGIYVIECERSNGSVHYDNIPLEPRGIDAIGEDGYLLVDGSTAIGKFDNGAYNSSYNSISPYNASAIQVASSGDYYILDKTNSLLLKYVNDALVWPFALTGNMPTSNILLRESEGVIIYYDKNNSYTIRDDGASAKLIFSAHIGNGIKADVVGSNHFSSSHVFGRARQVYGDTLPLSSSSSSSSIDSSSSSIDQGVDYTQDSNAIFAFKMDGDDGSGPIPDASGNGNTGALFGDGEPDFAADGVYYGRYNFSLDTVTVTNPTGLSGATELSSAFWVRHENDFSDEVIVTRGSINLATTGFQLWREDTVALGAQTGYTDAFTAFVYDGADFTAISSANSSADTSWHHVAFTFKSGSSTGLKLYLDGDLVRTGDASDVDGLLTNSNDVTLGAYSTGTSALVGDISESILLDRELTHGEILEIYRWGIDGTKGGTA